MTTILRLNGREMTIAAAPFTPLLDVLREEVGDTTPKPGCREGRCGACTVLLDGRAVLSCMLPLGRAADGEITTLEGLNVNDGLTAVQAAFSRAGSVQCGICTPGMLLAVQALVDEGRPLERAAVREALVNNLCRCTGYVKIVDAVEALLVATGEEGQGEVVGDA